MSKKRTKKSKGKRVKTRKDKIKEQRNTQIYNTGENKDITRNEKDIKKVNKKQKSIKRKNKLKKQLQNQRIQQKRVNEETVKDKKKNGGAKNKRKNSGARNKSFNNKKSNRLNKEEDSKQIVSTRDEINAQEKANLNEKGKKVEKRVVIVINAIMLIAIILFLYLLFRPKFKDVSIELGTESISVDNFLVSSMYKKNAKSITDLSQIDFSKVGAYDIVLAFNGKNETVKLNIVDTIAPKVKFTDLHRYIGYEINAEDFIVEKEDLSEMTVSILEAPENLDEYSDYKVKISVKDSSGNETIGECNLSISWILDELYQELGMPLDVNKLVLGNSENESKIPQSEIDKVNTSVIGEYEIRTEYEGKEYVSKIIVQDTTPPDLELKNITIYDDERIDSYTQFIKSVSDISGKPSTSLKTEIDYSKIGNQEIVIEAVDVNGNRVEKTAVLTITKDVFEPVISGLTNITVRKNSQINYYSGVKAVDEKDGACEITVDSSGVNVSVAGTYYATYISKDTKGNTTRKTRKIMVEHDESDTNAKFEEFYNKYCAGKDIVSMSNEVRTRITYEANWGGNDPVWYGLTEGKGNCYVHTMIMQRCLQKAGYTNQIIYRLDKGHYWNLVYIDGVWRHLDSTPSLRHTKGLLTDEQKWNDAGLDGVGWDRSLWPAAE